MGDDSIIIEDEPIPRVRNRRITVIDLWAVMGTEQEEETLDFWEFTQDEKAQLRDYYYENEADIGRIVEEQTPADDNE